MSTTTDAIREIDPSQIDDRLFGQQYSDCVILTADKKLLLQLRSATAKCPDHITAFGGHIETGETPMQTLVRELHEELGAQADPDTIVKIGSVTESDTGHTEIVHCHFWHDRCGSISGCYEGQPLYFDTAAAALARPEIMDYLVWLLTRCRELGLLK